MATAAEGGAGGKFRKRPSRRTHTTPYDRPPTALRPIGNGSWISKLVDPASKLITSGANRLFSSVFRKRLPAPPLALPPAQETNQDSRDNRQEAITTVQEAAIIEYSNASKSSDGGSFAELEQILKLKTFTRSEIDHLTELLRARTQDLPVGESEKRPEANCSNLVADHDRQQNFAHNPVHENGIQSHKFFGATSTPVVSPRVSEEDVASPAELAKAYMGSRPSKVSPSMLGFRSQAFKEEGTLPSNPVFTPKPSITSLVQRSSLCNGIPDNSFRTLRSRGRSAIYSMARTPYSRAPPIVAQKGTGSTIDGYGGPSSSSRSTWDQNGILESKQVALKRRSSVLDEDVGSVGPIRRIRQKPNLLSAKGLSLPSSGTPLSRRGTGAGSDATQLSVSVAPKSLIVDESKHKTSKVLAEYGDNSVPGTNFSSVPSQSSETAAKILQHLDKLVSPLKEKLPELKQAAAREKSPAKLTTAMLHGQALRSLENVETPKFLQNIQDDNRKSDSHIASLPYVRDFTSQKQDKVESNGPMKTVASRDRVAPVMQDLDTTFSIEDTVPIQTADSATMKFIADPSKKKRSFQMSAHEDYLDLDDDDGYGAASVQLAEGKEKMDSNVVENKVAAEAVEVEKPSAFSEVKLPTNSVSNRRTDLETSDVPVVAEKNTGFTFALTTAPSATVQSTFLTPKSTSTVDPPVPPKELNVVPLLFGNGSKNVDKISPFTFSASSVNESSGLKSGACSNPSIESSSSFASGAIGAVPPKPESDKGEGKRLQKDVELFRKPDPAPLFVASTSSPPLAVSTATATSTSTSTSTSNRGIFSFGVNAVNPSLNNGSLSSSPSIFSSQTLSLGSNGSPSQIFSSSTPFTAVSTGTTAIATSVAPSAIDASSSALSTSSAAPSFPSAPIFNFGPSVAPALVSPVLAASGGETAGETKKTQETTTFGGTSTISSTGSSAFGFGASVPSSTAKNQPQGSTLFGIGSGSLATSQVSSSGTGVASFSQSTPIQFGSSAPSPIFGSTGPAPFSSSSSLFGSTAATSFGSSSLASASEPNSIGSGSGTGSGVFGSSWQSNKSPIFGSTFNSTSSTEFSFGSSASVPVSSSASMFFGSSTGSSSGSLFSFTSAAATAASSSLSPSQPVFGNSNSVFAFGLAPSVNNDQMNTEDSMAEDNVQVSTPAVPAFGQPPVSPPSGFVFGSSAAPSAAPSPFQFGGQQNQSTPPNPSPFQASGSLDFNAGGSFSLGTGGGTDKSSRKMIRVKHKQRRK
ncbi:nuclear pore complex protein NUP1 isoform X2 [Malania oleifera]|uniref:nuclear pore complex protein NUP1 isoform X2 n=1 Tax=Malania oleifera TaxID=397392 RepID=UPI0025AE631D|nr:nuclear pore complex protein NUP1 isoform X2 [Malania oleifera]